MNPADNWREEQRSAYLYSLLAELEASTPRHALFRELAKESREQSEAWAAAARASGIGVPDSFRPDARTRLVAQLTRWLGPRAMRSALAAMKVRGMSVDGDADARYRSSARLVSTYCSLGISPRAKRCPSAALMACG
jgi:hypothetical protein